MNYFGWVLLLELVCIASPLRADDTGTMFSLLPAITTNILFLSSEYGQWEKNMAGALHKCPTESQRAAGTGSSTKAGRAAIRTRAMMSNTRVSAVASKSASEQTWQSTEKVKPGKNIEQELLFSSSYSHSLRIQNLHWTCFPYTKFSHFLSEAGRVTSCNPTKQ